jgi:hypothetical protein
MDKNFYLPFKLMLFKGIIGIIIVSIGLIISSNIKCRNIVDFINEAKSSSYFSKIMTPHFCYDIYKGFEYFDSVPSYFSTFFSDYLDPRLQYNPKYYKKSSSIDYDFFKHFKDYEPNQRKYGDDKYIYLEIFVTILIFFIFNPFGEYFQILTNKIFTPFHTLIINSSLDILMIFFKTTNHYYLSKQMEKYNDDQGKSLESTFLNNFEDLTTFGIKAVSQFFILVRILIYLEVIELRFCNFDKDTIKLIRIRAIEDNETMELTDNLYERNSSLFELKVN